MQSDKEFIKGFITGILSLIFIVFLLLRIFVLRSGLETVRNRRRRKVDFNHLVGEEELQSKSRERTRSRLSSEDFLCSLANSLASNVISNPKLMVMLRLKLESVINHFKVDFLDYLSVNNLIVDEFRTSLEISKEDESELADDMRFTMRIESAVVLQVETSLLINWPQRDTASLPIQLKITLNGIKGDFYLKIADGLLETVAENLEFSCEFSSLLGERPNAKNFLQVNNLIEDMLHNAVNSLVGQKNRMKIEELVSLLLKQAKQT